jgi:predicted ATPase with chaperone activity
MPTMRAAPANAAVNTQPGGAFHLPVISQVEDTGLSALWLQDLALKILYFQGYMSGFKIAEEMALPHAGVVDAIMEALKREKYVEVKSTQQVGLGEGSYQYAITGAGIARAREALERSQYAGPAPVPLKMYNEAILRQSKGRPTVVSRVLRQTLSELVLSEKTFQRIGPAINSGTSIFLYGPPGNGKTSIARAIGSMILRESMYIPYSIYIDGQVVKLFDSVNHQLARDDDSAPLGAGTGSARGAGRRDPRWVRIRRPFIVVGGELNMAGLDLVFDDVNKFYEAPFQVKANGGIFLIDDFGRQQVRPRDLLNRWIVPLENRIDYLTLHTGRKVELPFDVLVVFSTNLPPKDLVDEAFLRRLRHKIEIGDPSYEEFREIFKRVAAAKNVIYNDQGLAYLLQEWYIKRNRKLRASHPRDLCDQLLDIARYLSQEPAMSPDLIDRAAESYFVELS